MPTTFERFTRRTAPAVAPRLDDRLVRAAVAWSLQPRTAVEDAADQLVVLAAGNRSAMERAIGRVRVSMPVSRRSEPGDTTSGRAAAVLRLALARGTWSW